MFGDWGWDSTHSEAQERQLKSWLGSIVGASIVIVECGAGTAIPTVRLTCQDIASRYRGKLIRINPREPEVPAGQISLPMGALNALVAVDDKI
jgi:hypothetical protein